MDAFQSSSHRYIQKVLFGEANGVDNYSIVNTCIAGKVCISPTKFILNNREHSFLFVATNSVSKLQLHIEYVTAILFNVTVLLESTNLFGCLSQRGGAFSPNSLPCICYYMNAIPALHLSLHECQVYYSYNVHCVFFTLLPVIFYYIIEKLRKAKQGLRGAKTRFSTLQNAYGSSHEQLTAV